LESYTHLKTCAGIVVGDQIIGAWCTGLQQGVFDGEDCQELRVDIAGLFGAYVNEDQGISVVSILAVNIRNGDGQ